MVRLLILGALLSMTLAAIGTFAPGTPPPVDAATAAATTAAPAAPLGLPSLDLMSFGLGTLAGLIIGWVWSLPWRNMRELTRELFVRSLRGFGVVGLAMAAAAVILFY